MACCDRSGPALFRGCLSGSLQRGPQRSCERLQDLFFVSFGPYAFLFDICQYLWLWYIVYIYIICWAAECLAQFHVVGSFFA